MARKSSQPAETRQRVLDAAGEIIAEKGFDRTTIREIADRAGANLNAVNYYFRDKQGLYLALFEHAHQIVLGKDRDEFDQHHDLPPDEQLRAMIAHVLRGFILTRRAPWQARGHMMERPDTSARWRLAGEDGYRRPGSASRFGSSDRVQTQRRQIGSDDTSSCRRNAIASGELSTSSRVARWMSPMT